MFAIIGGSGLAKLSTLEAPRRQVMRTPYGEPSGPLSFGTIAGRPVVFLARHGYGHTIPPHLVNYRAGALATNVVINLLLPPGKLAQTVKLSSPENPPLDPILPGTSIPLES